MPLVKIPYDFKLYGTSPHASNVLASIIAGGKNSAANRKTIKGAIKFITEVNEKACKILGYRVRHIRGKDFRPFGTIVYNDYSMGVSVACKDDKKIFSKKIGVALALARISSIQTYRDTSVWSNKRVARCIKETIHYIDKRNSEPKPNLKPKPSAEEKKSFFARLFGL